MTARRGRVQKVMYMTSYWEYDPSVVLEPVLRTAQTKEFCDEEL